MLVAVAVAVAVAVVVVVVVHRFTKNRRQGPADASQLLPRSQLHSPASPKVHWLLVGPRPRHPGEKRLRGLKDSSKNSTLQTLTPVSDPEAPSQ